MSEEKWIKFQHLDGVCVYGSKDGSGEIMSRKHTPLPWEKEKMPNGYFAIRRVGHDPNKAMVTDTDYDQVAVSEEDADLIVKTVNCHAELVKLLEDIKDHTQYMMENHGYDRGWYDADSNLEKRVNAILKKVNP